MDRRNLNSMNFSRLPATPINSAWLFRAAYGILPILRMYYPLLKKWGSLGGLLSVPWGRYRLYFPSAWLKTACAMIYKTPVASNPEFFALVAPALRSLNAGSIVDVGANMGAYLLNFRSCSNAPIIAFEPEPFIFKLLTHNARANQLDRVDLRNVACGETTATVVLNAGVNSCIAADGSRQQVSTAAAADDFESAASEFGLAKAPVSVPLVRLDDELGAVDSISFLKIDCEGYEYHILAGAREMLRKHRPVVFVELHPTFIENYGHTIPEVCDVLRPDYELEFWDFDRAERSASLVTRFVGRYTNAGVRFPDEAAMLSALRQQPRPTQVFLLARPKRP